MNSFFANLFRSQTISFADFPLILLSMVLALLAGLFIAWIYRRNYRGVMYSNNFALTLIMMTLITCPVVMCIRQSIQLSMGMVGALSIVRFRTAVKDPLDTAYMFWALTMGILLGAGQYIISLVVVITISVILLVLSFVHFRNPNSYLLVMHYDEYAEGDIEAELRRSARYNRLRSKTVTRAGAEMTYEVRMDQKADLVGRMLDIEGVHDATLVAMQTETGA